MMRFLLALSLFAFSVAPGLAQSRPLLPDAMVQALCNAPQITSGADVDEVMAIALRLTTDPHIHIAVTDSTLINARALNLSADASLICVPVAMVHFMGAAEGELAFILAHEMGHATDKACKTPKGRFRAAEQSGIGTALVNLFDQVSGDGAAEQRACEARADELGFNRMTCAGYDPNDAVASLQRLSNVPGYSPTAPLIIARLAALGDDHPITPDRIHHLRKLIARAASGRAHSPSCPLTEALDSSSRKCSR